MNRDFYNGFMSKCAEVGMPLQQAEQIYSCLIKHGQAATARFGSWKDNLDAAKAYWEMITGPKEELPWYHNEGYGVR